MNKFILTKKSDWLFSILITLMALFMFGCDSPTEPESNWLNGKWFGAKCAKLDSETNTWERDWTQNLSIAFEIQDGQISSLGVVQIIYNGGYLIDGFASTSFVYNNGLFYGAYRFLNYDNGFTLKCHEFDKVNRTMYVSLDFMSVRYFFFLDMEDWNYTDFPPDILNKFWEKLNIHDQGGG